MNDSMATGVIAVLFVLRCLLPLVLTLVVGYIMNRIAAGWEEDTSYPPPLPKP